MTKLTAYTIVSYKADKRLKEGKRLVETLDLDPSTKFAVDTIVAAKVKAGFIVELFETYVTKTNLMTGKPYQERYDTPYYCSAASESYWAN